MFRNPLCGVLTVTLMAAAAYAQQPAGNPPPPPQNVHQLQQPDQTVTYTSAADVAALITKAKEASAGDTSMVVGKILHLAPYTASIEYRPANKSLHFPAGVHPKEAELFYVIDGAGTLVTGGTLTADKMGIDGGQAQKVSKGDFIFIPEGTPHWFSQVDQTLVLMSLHVPRSSATPAQ